MPSNYNSAVIYFCCRQVYQMALSLVSQSTETNDKNHHRLSVLMGVEDPVSQLTDSLKLVVLEALDGQVISRDNALRLADSSSTELGSICKAASIIRDQGKGCDISFSPKVFIPLTMLCRDFCGYCTFRRDPGTADRLYMTPENVLDVAISAERLGCTEILFTLGERPEQRYPEAREWLQIHGYKTTLEYLHDVSALVIEKTSILPHGNPGTMSRREMESLKEVNVSMGIMLESISARLCEPGGPHEFAPSKWPKARMKTIETAGKLKIPFTTGILIGIGETLRERIESILELRELHRRYGHIQEVIIQNFRAKVNTPMSGDTEPGTDDLLWTAAVARLILGPYANIQVPPNLSAADYHLLLLAGINDWGGVSPITIDYVNPEAPWPQIGDLRRRTEDLGFTLRPRLPVYPEYIKDSDKQGYLPDDLKVRVKSLVNEDGYVKWGVDRYVKHVS